MRNIASIEVIANGIDGGGAAGARSERLFLGGGHGAQGSGQVRLMEDLAGQRHAAVGKEGFLRIRPEVEEAPRTRNGTRALFIDRDAVGKFDGRLNDLVERFSSEISQRDQSCVYHARDDRGQDAGDRNNAFQSAGLERENLTGAGPVLSKELCRRHFRHGSDAGDRHDLAFLGADQYGRFAAKSEMGELGDGSREHARDAGVHRVATLKVHAHSGFGAIFAAAGKRAMSTSRSMCHGRFHKFLLRRADAQQTDKEHS